MNFKKTPYLIGLFIVLISGWACNSDDDQAINSIRGTWEVTSITSIYGQFVENGFNPSETITETGALGFFNFSNDAVAFEFTRNDTLYSGNDIWSITSEKVNAGFTQETKYNLIIENHFLFEVNFGDGTKNSERNAESATFIESPDIGFGALIELELEKR